ncbi:PQQ-dependent sugar dehydrogenase [Mariniflexile sp.]|uniref:PQQ-dependent sugar dehydrogenase n=1 Tax=Mariniflexile sp. TaxID=1979402 RepID=UPI003563CBBC
MKQLHLILTFILLSFYSCAQQSESSVKAEDPTTVNYTTELVVPDISIPWGIAFLPDGSMLITEKAGELIHFKNGKKTLIEGVPEIYVRGQGGFMGIKLHPNYETNGWIYFAYASAEGEGEGGNTAIMRAKLNNNKLTDKEVLYKASPNSKRGQHFGARIEFDNEGYLYFSIGERGEGSANAQDLTRDCGKIYRLHDDGRIPKDNPFLNVPNAKTAIYTYGNRNPQGLIKNPYTGDIWSHEHGPKGGDEINIIKKGANYGWQIVSYGINYNGTSFTDITEKEGIEPPIFYWVPSIAPSGMAFVTSNKYPGWKGNLLVGSLKFAYLERLVLENEKVVKREKLIEKTGRVRDVVQGPDGYIYVAVEGKGIVKIVPKN